MHYGKVKKSWWLWFWLVIMMLRGIWAGLARKYFLQLWKGGGHLWKIGLDRGQKSEGFEELIQSDFRICDAKSFLLQGVLSVLYSGWRNPKDMADGRVRQTDSDHHAQVYVVFADVFVAFPNLGDAPFVNLIQQLFHGLPIFWSHLVC